MDTDNLNLFGKNARLPGGPNDENPTARHEGEPVPAEADPEADKDLVQPHVHNEDGAAADEPADDDEDDEL